LREMDRTTYILKMAAYYSSDPHSDGGGLCHECANFNSTDAIVCIA